MMHSTSPASLPQPNPAFLPSKKPPRPLLLVGLPYLLRSHFLRCQPVVWRTVFPPPSRRRSSVGLLFSNACPSLPPGQLLAQWGNSGLAACKSNSYHYNNSPPCCQTMSFDDAFCNLWMHFEKPVSSTPPGSPQTNVGVEMYRTAVGQTFPHLGWSTPWRS